LAGQTMKMPFQHITYGDKATIPHIDRAANVVLRVATPP
jgi:hypothetical protein